MAQSGGNTININNMYGAMNVHLGDIIDEYHCSHFTNQSPYFSNSWVKIFQTFESNINIDPDLIRYAEVQRVLDSQADSFKNFISYSRQNIDQGAALLAPRLKENQFCAEVSVFLMYFSHLLFEMANEMMRVTVLYICTNRCIIVWQGSLGNCTLMFKYLQYDYPNTIVSITRPLALYPHSDVTEMKENEAVYGKVNENLPFVKVGTASTTSNMTVLITGDQLHASFPPISGQPHYMLPDEFYPQFFKFIKEESYTEEETVLKYRQVMENNINIAVMRMENPIYVQLATEATNIARAQFPHMEADSWCNPSRSFCYKEVINVLEDQRKWYFEFISELHKVLAQQVCMNSLYCKIHLVEITSMAQVDSCQNCQQFYNASKTLITNMNALCQLTNTMLMGACILNRNAAVLMKDYFPNENIDAQNNAKSRINFERIWNRNKRVKEEVDADPPKSEIRRCALKENNANQSSIPIVPKTEEPDDYNQENQNIPRRNDEPPRANTQENQNIPTTTEEPPHEDTQEIKNIPRNTEEPLHDNTQDIKNIPRCTEEPPHSNTQEQQNIPKRVKEEVNADHPKSEIRRCALKENNANQPSIPIIPKTEEPDDYNQENQNIPRSIEKPPRANTQENQNIPRCTEEPPHDNSQEIKNIPKCTEEPAHSSTQENQNIPTTTEEPPHEDTQENQNIPRCTEEPPHSNTQEHQNIPRSTEEPPHDNTQENQNIRRSSRLKQKRNVGNNELNNKRMKQ